MRSWAGIGGSADDMRFSEEPGSAASDSLAESKVETAPGALTAEVRIFVGAMKKMRDASIR